MGLKGNVVRALVAGALGLMVVLGGAPASTCEASVTIWGTGVSWPQSIAVAPQSWSAYAGWLFVPDSVNNTLKAFSPSGGQAVTISTLPSTPVPLGGLFLPDGFGPQGGQYITASTLGNGSQRLNTLKTLSPYTGTTTLWSEQYGTAPYPAGTLLLDSMTTPVMAPDNWGKYADKLIYTEQVNQQLATITPTDGGYTVAVTNHVLSNISTTTGLPFKPYGAAFAPAGFGSFGGALLLSDTTSGKIVAAWPDDTVTTFASVVLTPVEAAATAGLRQMAFVPEGFGNLSGLLLVAVSGSLVSPSVGNGRLLALDGAGDVVGELVPGSGLGNFDPRGVYFTSSGQILISDVAGGRILAAGPGDFQFVPEPATISLLTLGSLFILRRRR